MDNMIDELQMFALIGLGLLPLMPARSPRSTLLSILLGALVLPIVTNEWIRLIASLMILLMIGWLLLPPLPRSPVVGTNPTQLQTERVGGVPHCDDLVRANPGDHDPIPTNIEVVP